MEKKTKNSHKCSNILYIKKQNKIINHLLADNKSAKSIKKFIAIIIIQEIWVNFTTKNEK